MTGLQGSATAAPPLKILQTNVNPGAALRDNVAGNDNVAVGHQAGKWHNIHIGSDGGAGESDTIRIGQSQTQTFVAGVVGAGPGPTRHRSSSTATVGKDAP